MKLKFEELKAKNTITIPEEHINYFSEKTLRLAKKEIMNILNVTEVSTDDIEEFVISDIFETTKELGVLKEQLFTCLPADGEFAWRVICDENIVAIDSYIVDGEENEFKPHTTLEVVFSEEDICNLSFKIDDDSLEDNEELSETIAVIRVSMLLRLCFYLFTLKSKKN